MQGDEEGFVKARTGLQFGHKGVVRLGQQLGLHGMEQLSIDDVQPVLGQLCARLIDVTLMELILGHAAASSVRQPWPGPEEMPGARSLQCAWKSLTFLVATVNPCTIAVAAIMASSYSISDVLCIKRAHRHVGAACVVPRPRSCQANTHCCSPHRLHMPTLRIPSHRRDQVGPSLVREDQLFQRGARGSLQAAPLLQCMCASQCPPNRSTNWSSGVCGPC